MKPFAKLFSLLLLTLSLTLTAAPDTRNWVKPPERSWHLTLESALEAAKKSGRKIFVFHTGSDWCGWCKKLKKDVLTTSRFRNYARRNLEFVYLDSPSKRISMPDAQRNYNNQTWRSLRGGGGVPCALVLDSQGRTLGTMSGYRPLKNYLEALDGLLRKQPSSQAVPVVSSREGTAAAVKKDAQGWLAAPEGWFNKLETALVQARKENKKVLVLATGSDWCPPCKKFGSLCLPSEEFKSFARENLVLVCLDLPRGKNMPADQRAYNRKTISQIGMGGGVPSFAILNAQGEKLSLFTGFSTTDSFMTRLKEAVKMTPEQYKTQIEDRRKEVEVLRSAKITVEGWKLTPEDPMRSLAELPRELKRGQQVYFYLNYELPENLPCRIFFLAPGARTRRPGDFLSGKGQFVTTLTFGVGNSTQVRSLLIHLRSKNTGAFYKRIPCNIQIVR